MQFITTIPMIMIIMIMMITTEKENGHDIVQ